MVQRERTQLIVILSLSVLLSLYLCLKTPVISLDGAFQYIPMAKAFSSGAYREGISINGQQPLYPFLVGVAGRWVPNLEWAGKGVASLFSVLLVIPVYWIGKRFFGRDVAFFSTLLLAIHPYLRRFSGDVLKESTYLFFLAVAIGFALRAFQRNRVSAYFFIPFFSALPYLVRPDGVEVLVAVFIATLFLVPFEGPEKRRRAILFLILSSLLLFLPHLLYLKAVTGEWALSKTKDLATLFGYQGTTGGVPLVTRLLYSFKKLNLEIIAVYHPLFLFLLGIGLLRRRSIPWRMEEKFLLLLSALHYGILFLLILNTTGWSMNEASQDHLFSGRHVLPLVLFTIYWVGGGLLTLHRWVCETLNAWGWLPRWGDTGRGRAVWAVFLAGMLFITLPKTLKPNRYEKLPEKWAGIWIQNQQDKGGLIFTTVPRVAFYAGKPYQVFDPQKDRLEDVRASMAEKGARYLVVRDKDLNGFSKGVDSLKEHFTEVMRYEKEGMERVVIYKRMTL